MKDKLILSFYVDIRGMEDPNQIASYVEQVKGIVYEQLDPNKDGDVAIFFFPIKGESRIECVNPVLVTEK